MSTHNLCFEQKYEKYQNLYQKTSSFLVAKFSVYLNRRVFVMYTITVKYETCWEKCLGFRVAVGKGSMLAFLLFTFYLILL